jgi:hypothetical protein
MHDRSSLEIFSMMGVSPGCSDILSSSSAGVTRSSSCSGVVAWSGWSGVGSSLNVGDSGCPISVPAGPELVHH